MIKKNFIFNTLLILISLIIASCERDVSTTPDENPIYNGTIVMDSDPKGAAIFLNGDNTSKVTPDSITHLEPGTYNIEYFLDLYLPIVDTIVVGENQKTVFYKNFYDDLRNYGSVTCYSFPENAAIKVNDVSTNLFTPATVTGLWPGFYRFTCSLPEHRDKSYYIAVYGGQEKTVNFYLQDTSICVDYNPSNSDFPAINSSCVEVDDNGVVWVGNNSDGVARYENGMWTFIQTGESGYPQNGITCMKLDNRGNKWFGTKKGVALIDTQDNLTVINDFNGIKLDLIFAIENDQQGNIYVVSSNSNTRKYLWKFDGTEWIHYDFPANKVILSLLADGENRLWLGLNRGVLVWENGEYNIPPGDYWNSRGLASEIVHTIKKDGQGQVWFGTVNQMVNPGGLYVFDGYNYSKISLPHNYVSHINIDNEDNKWISCFGRFGINTINELTSVFVKIDRNNNIRNYSMALTKIATGLLSWSAKAPDGTIWIASRDKGIIKFKVWNM